MTKRLKRQGRGFYRHYFNQGNMMYNCCGSVSNDQGDAGTRAILIASLDDGLLSLPIATE